MEVRRSRLVDRNLVHGLARLSTAIFIRAYDDGRLAKLGEDLSRDLGWLEGRYATISAARREFAREARIKLIAWGIAIFSFGFAVVDVLSTGRVGLLGGLSVGFGAVGIGLGLLMDRLGDRRQRAHNRALGELQRELVDLTTALARVRAARILKRSGSAGRGRETSGR